MKIRITLATVLLLSGLMAIAQTTYQIVPGQCPMNDIPTQCSVTMSPANPLGFYPSLTLYDDLSNNSVDNAPPGDTYRLLEFETTQGPSGGYLGNGVVQVNASIPYGQPGHYRSYPLFAQFCNASGTQCITDVAALTVYFEGNYAPASGGGFYSGSLTMHFGYKWIYYRGAWRVERNVTGGAVTIN